MSKARELAELGAVYDSGALSNRNIIINGAMKVAQRGTSTTTSGDYLIDRFAADNAGGTVTYEQVSLSSSDTPYSSGFRNAAKLTNTSAGSAAATDYRRLMYRVEGQDMAGSGWNYTSSSSSITLSFWVKSSLAGTYSVSFHALDGTAQAYSFDYTVVADTWKKITHTLPGNSNLTFDNDTGQSFRISIWPYIGTNFTTSSHTDEAWAAYDSSSQAGDFAQNWASTASATFFVTGVQFEVGTEATPFEHRSFGDEIARCQRYFYQPVNNTVSGQRHGFYDAAAYSSSSTIYGVIRFPVTMRSAPSYTVNNIGEFRIRSGGDTVATGSNIHGSISANSAMPTFTASGTTFTAGRHTWVETLVDGQIFFDAEL